MNIAFAYSKLYCILILILSALQTNPQQLDAFIFTDERVPVTPKEFYIKDVIDERTNKSAIASLLPAGPNAKPYAVDIKGGALPGIKQFINTNLPKNKELRPLIIGLKKIGIKETALPNNLVEGRVVLTFSFYLDKGDDDKIHLADYSGTAIYNRDAAQTQNIGPTLQRVLVNGLVYINTWMNQQAETNIKLAHGVKITFSDYEEKPEGDSIYYSVKRPLTWADFQSKIPTSQYSAEVFPTIGYDLHAEIVKGIVNLHLTVKTCLPKSACWAKDDSRSDYTLNHEQRHFDIVKIVSEHFKQKLAAGELTVDNYEGTVNMEYLDTYREMNIIQKQYDDETRHGTETAEQGGWNLRIDKELKALGIK
ncbi:hypothetical protein [Mucilaginibacter flavidus]|uniref:hypothetical protein n=1 Tax=Mucilaginibacter flavidus TaxID=2949309 RepID=UPI002092AB71|nr:hypothetical protein [Mucilaginibacter flavidus]MCO5949710.1 hypothetical protein [Mucilaginibacter flavidus]